MSKLNPNAGEFVPCIQQLSINDPLESSMPNETIQINSSIENSLLNETHKEIYNTDHIKSIQYKNKSKNHTRVNNIDTESNQESKYNQNENKKIIYSIYKILEFQSICDTAPLCTIPKEIKSDGSFVKIGQIKNNKKIYTNEEILKFRYLYSFIPPGLPSHLKTNHSHNSHSKAKKLLKTTPRSMSGGGHRKHDTIFIYTPEEELKQMTLAMNNYLDTLQNNDFDASLCSFIKNIQVNYVETLQLIVDIIFEKALLSCDLNDLYGRLCSCLSEKLPEFKDGPRTVNFRRILLNKCYLALTSTDILEQNNNESDLSPINNDNMDNNDINKKKYIIQNIIFIGELFRRHLLTENVMHVCIALMLDNEINPNPTIIIAACRLLLLIGDLLDGSSPSSRRTMDEYFECLERLFDYFNIEKENKSNDDIKDILKETIELRANGWIKKKNINISMHHHNVTTADIQEKLIQSKQLRTITISSPSKSPKSQISPKSPKLSTPRLKTVLNDNNLIDKI